MAYILGLDIGSNSVGWAAIDLDGGRFHGAGVRVFPEGVDRDTTGTEKSKNVQRRTARGHRRQIARRARRKALLRQAVRECGWWNDETSPGLIQADPLALRAKALDEQLTLPELARVFMHLNQRRGFLSNRKADRGRAKENSETLQEISQLQDDIVKSGSRTLGEYFHRLRTQDPAAGRGLRVRGRHTHREMFLKEFEQIWESQQRFYPDLLTDQLKFGRQGEQTYPKEPLPRKRAGGVTFLAEFGFHGLLFFQRSLYWPKSVIGRCELEPREKRCERADRLAQRFRLLNEVNNLRVIPQSGEPRELEPEERQKLIAYLSDKKEATFDQIRKHLSLLEGNGFNLEAGKRTKLDGMPIDAALAGKKLFAAAWKKKSEQEKNAIVRSILDDEEPEILRMATTEWGCDEDLARKLADLDLTAIVRGYASYSRAAIQKLLPHLEAGHRMMSRDGAPSAIGLAGYLRPDQKQGNKGNQLPLPSEKIVNPLVKQALYEVRRVVHAAIREWGMPGAIHVELAREVQGTAARRQEQIERMRLQEARRRKAADFIRERGFSPTRGNIERYLLWDEQGESCAYSFPPRMISPNQLFSSEVDVDHILPYSRSLDDSLMNKVLAFRSENHDKRNQTVWEWVGESNPAKYESILQRARNLPQDIRNRKRVKLQTRDVILAQFLNRQLTDTAYITTQVVDLLRHLEGVDVVPVKGQCTAELRHMWGMNGVLHDDGLNFKKNRDDHRHHAVDAIVIALTNRSTLQMLARVRGTDEQLDPPWRTFRDDVETVVAGIKVSHKAVRDLSGALHEETIYGATSKPQRSNPKVKSRPHARSWIEKEGIYVVRKRLEDLTLAMVDDIRDPQVKSLVLERLATFNLKPGEKEAKIPKDVWKEPLLLTRKAGRTSLQPSVIRKVRLVKRDSTITPIRHGSACVKPGNTHHISIFELPAAKGKKPKRILHAVTMMEATQRARRKEPLVSRKHPDIPEAKFLFSLSWGEMISANIGGREDLFVFRTASSTTEQMVFVSHSDARMSKDCKAYRARPNTLDAAKVTVDSLGRIRNAND
ncbi:type II CRISPR RNA-guided endonuclease Cas9 [Planctomicrobium sp. SH664]|uniref:type II CRISPR RNA-guided endonuclease Cas9 n=1 Tax=Planctomicrobium sp. SH664 TaxID=3448125 RepID=UPI003F5B73BA